MKNLTLVLVTMLFSAAVFSQSVQQPTHFDRGKIYLGSNAGFVGAFTTGPDVAASLTLDLNPHFGMFLMRNFMVGIQQYSSVELAQKSRLNTLSYGVFTRYYLNGMHKVAFFPEVGYNAGIYNFVGENNTVDKSFSSGSLHYGVGMSINNPLKMKHIGFELGLMNEYYFNKNMNNLNRKSWPNMTMGIFFTF